MPYNDHSELIIEKTGNFTVNNSVSVDTVTVEEGGALSINGDLNLTESLEIKEGGTLKTTGAIKVVSTEDIAPEEMIKLPDNYLPDGYSVQKVEDSSGKYYYAIAKDGELAVDDDGNLSGVSSNITIVPPAEPEPEPEEKTDYMMVTVLMYMLQNSHKISFETNGGDKLVPQMKLVGTEIEASDYVVEREGCTFAGWYFDEELTEPADEFSLISDVTLWAAWEADEAEADDDVEAEPAE
ncbi:MAG TPA: InlB B-repeat-containing protein [Firmicutes bacterium]|nr:InlB B-repeat-containing protein [Bacillota bacterium]